MELPNVVSSLKRKSSAGFDGFPVRYLKTIFPLISATFLKLINIFFRNGIFSYTHKMARVVPTHKRGDPNAMINYSPIYFFINLLEGF